MHILIYNKELGDLREVASAVNECTNDEDTLHLVHSYGHMISYIEDGCADMDLIITDVADNTAEIIDLLNFARRENPKLMVIFASKREDLVFQMYEVEHIAFLPIPLDMRMVRIALDTARRHYALNHRMNGVIISNRNFQVFLLLGEIMYAESNLRVVDIYTASGNKLTITMKLNAFQEELDTRFVRCHQSYIVNMQYVKMYLCDMNDPDYAYIEMKNGNRIPVSVRRQKETRNALLKYYRALMHRTEDENIYII